MLTRDQAIRKIQREAQTENAPCVSKDDVGDILDEHVRALPRTDLTAYTIGTKIVWGNGRMYACIGSGTSGTGSPANGATVLAQSVEDGSVLWQDCGPSFGETWDISAAIGAVWRLKASMDSALIDVADKDTKIEITKRRDFATRQANRYMRSFVV